MYDLMNSLNAADTQTNDLESFRAYLDDPDSPIHEYLSAIQYSYDLDLPIYTKDADGNIVRRRRDAAPAKHDEQHVRRRLYLLF